MDRLYTDVIKNELGYFELKPAYQKDMDSFYEEEYYQNQHALYRTEYSGEELAYKNNLYRQKEYIVKTIVGGDCADRLSFLDIGCGEGYALSWFDRNGWDVAGIDESVYGIRSHNSGMEARMIQGDFLAEKEKLAEKHYDFINIDNVLEHVIRPDEFLEAVAALCDRQTTVCVTVPNDFSVIQKIAYEMGQIDGPFWVTKETSEHFSYFGRESLEKAGNLADLPVDLFLLHASSNYRRRQTGHECHVAGITLENRLFSRSLPDTVKLHQAMALNGIGRDISMFFRLK